MRSVSRQLTSSFRIELSLITSYMSSLAFCTGRWAFSGPVVKILAHNKFSTISQKAHFQNTSLRPYVNINIRRLEGICNLLAYGLKHYFIPSFFWVQLLGNFSSFAFLVIFLKVSSSNWKSKLNKMIQSTTPFNNNNNKTVINPLAYFVEM